MKLQLQLFIPGLIWPHPAARALTRELQLPALERLLGAARAEQLPAQKTNAQHLAACFGLLQTDFSYAALRRLGEDQPPPAQTTDDTPINWLCADPVHLFFAQNNLALADPATLLIENDEALALSAELNRFFASLPEPLPALEVQAPTRWYWPLRQMPQVRFTALEEAIGRSADQLLAEGEQAAYWAALSNEIQILLHRHPINQARQLRQQPSINSLWFWGNGAHPCDPLSAPAENIFAHTPLARGLTRASRQTPLESTTFADLADGKNFVEIDFAALPAQRLDLAAWQNALQTLEQDWFAPAITALRQGRLQRLSIIAPGQRLAARFTINRWSLYHPLRRSRSLESVTALAS